GRGPRHPRVGADDQHPAGGAEARLGVDELVRDDDVRVVLEDPVAAGDARVERAALDVAGHLLRAHEETAEARVVDGGEVAARVGVDLPARAAEELDRRGLEAATRDAEPEDAHQSRGASRGVAITRESAPSRPSAGRKKQLR